MDMIKVIILGVIQGLTEFLPISSSGHLVIFQHFFGMKTDQLTLDVFLHFGTLIPIFIIFWSDIKDIILLKKEKRFLTCLILIGIIPTGIIGILFEDFFEKIFTSVVAVGFMLLITGMLLFLAERFSNTKKSLRDMKPVNAIIVGIAQGLAIIPGISRSGSTIVASLLQGLDRESAARYSFLISIPVILGAGLLQVKNVMTVGLTSLSWSMIIFGMLAAAISGYIAIKYLLYVLRKRSLNIFSYYCWIVGLLVILIAGLL